MKSILLTYTTKTGFTRKYATWISESIECKVIEFDYIDKVNIEDFDFIIYGAGIKAGNIRNLNAFKRKILKHHDKHIFVFATGGAPDDEMIITKIRNNNFSTEEMGKIKFFYFQSGLNYEKMPLSGRLMMNLYKLILKLKRNKSEVEKGTGKSVSASYDVSRKNDIKKLIDCLNEL